MHAALTLFTRLALLWLALMLTLAAPAIADDASDRAALDDLFAQLRVAPDAETAHAIDQRIWTIWTSPSDPELASRMLEVQMLGQVGNLPAAIAVLDEIVIDYPTYAEGWNRRATFHYMMNNLEASLADIDKVLEFEPRHFGALSGRALIYLALDRRPLALRDMATALEIHPFLTERRLFPELAQDMVRI